jgi:aminoglycoside phosphotransferase
MGRRKSRNRARRTPQGEPTPSSDDGEWSDWGGELMLVAGTTSGGAPYGTSVEDYRHFNEQWAGEAGWARAKWALRTAFETTTASGTEIDVGFVKALGGGLTRYAFGTSVDLVPDPEGRSSAYVALIPNGGNPYYGQSVRRELAILRWLAEQRIDVRTPRVVALVDDRGAPILVESFVEGMVVDLRAGRQARIRPWELVADVAAKIHALPPPPSFGMRTRREHRLAVIEALERIAHRHPIADEALAWMRDHLGPPLPGVLVHGDLLGQNLRIHPSDVIGVIDWHAAEVGDPVAELAIVTRGVNRPFQIDHGRQKLLDAYNERSATQVSAESLRFFELALVTRWVLVACAEGHREDAWLNQIARMLRGQ